MNEKLEELRSIIFGMDTFIGYWLDGISVSGAGDDDDVDFYAQADEYCNRALAIIEELAGGTLYGRQ